MDRWEEIYGQGNLNGTLRSPGDFEKFGFGNCSALPVACATLRIVREGFMRRV